MKKINFTKLVAAGNDFLAIEAAGAAGVKSLSGFAKKACDRKYGIGADGVLLLDKSKTADLKMRIFNADGSEAAMCGNGARCTALWAAARRGRQKFSLSIQTKAGIITAGVQGQDVRVRLTDPCGMRLGLPVKIAGRTMHVNFVDTGVPHAVVFCEGLDGIDVAGLGRQVRHHKVFGAAGANADFVEVIDAGTIKVRTYERGIEDETLACGTGVAASAVIFTAKSPCACQAVSVVRVLTRSGEILKVYLERAHNRFTNIWLQGLVRIVAQGVYYV